jgi:hypothetical protein
MKEKAARLASLLLEMPVILKSGKKVYADDKLLREVPLEYVRGNIVVFRSPKETFFPAGFTLVYFMDSEESAKAMAAGKLPYKVVQDRPRNAWNMSPITDVWKKKYDEGQQHILGVAQGITNEKEVYVDKLTVRPGYKRASISRKLIDVFKEHYPNAVVNFSGPTKQGAAFVKSYTGSDWKPAHGEHAEF